MQGILKRKFPHTTSPSLHIHKDSQIISKPKQEIRIIHVVAPEIIKTDVENFRELVQRLTGKPPLKNKKMKPRNKGRDVVMIKGEKEGMEIWSGSNTGNGSVDGFVDLDGFMQELEEFPLLDV